MSAEALNAFLQKAGKDQTLLAKIEETVKDEEGPARFVTLGREHGFEFSGKEAITHFYLVQNEELTEEQARAVTGGAGTPNINIGVNVSPTWFDRSRLGAVMHDAGPSGIGGTGKI